MKGCGAVKAAQNCSHQPDKECNDQLTVKPLRSRDLGSGSLYPKTLRMKHILQLLGDLLRFANSPGGFRQLGISSWGSPSSGLVVVFSGSVFGSLLWPFPAPKTFRNVNVGELSCPPWGTGTRCLGLRAARIC